MSQRKAKLEAEVASMQRFLQLEYLNWTAKSLHKGLYVPLKPDYFSTETAKPEIFLGFLEGVVASLVFYHSIEGKSKGDVISPALLDSLNQPTSKEDFDNQSRRTGSFKDLNDSHDSPDFKDDRQVMNDSKDIGMKTTHDERSKSTHKLNAILPPLKKVKKLTDAVVPRDSRSFGRSTSTSAKKTTARPSAECSTLSSSEKRTDLSSMTRSHCLSMSTETRT
jgi:hypothetical protein